MIWQYWQHIRSGDVYAVGISSIIDGEHEQSWVEDACGPLHYSEVTQKNLRDANFNNDPETAEWIRENIGDFQEKHI